MSRTARALAALSLSLTLAAVAAPARAADDAGTRSVFATGAGNRALAMGSAFAALADDASALLWNPGGLGDQPRTELQLAHASLDPLGFRESFAAFVLPDWRWGTAAVALRHYGVDGIDGRDERNRPTGEISDRETELALGYGRALSEAVSVGVVARVRRQELAGRSGGGLGADVGVTARPLVALDAPAGPWRDLRLGVAIQNAVEPSIRLDRESVADPTTVRAGLAIARPLGAGDWSATFDVETPRGGSARLHAGLELRAHPLLALRAGLDRGALAAGAGVGFGPAALDYAFAAHDGGGAHRAGLTWRFGRTVADARFAAARAEEERLRERLVALERERQAERVASLLAGAEAARAAGRPDEAIEALATLLAIDSTHAGAHALRAASLADRARALEAAGEWADAALAWSRALAAAPGDSAAASGLARSRAESDRRATRSLEIRRAFAAALDAFAADDYASARAGLRGILALSPDDAEAAAMLERVETAVARRASAWLRQADALLQAGSVAEAADLVDRVRRLDPRASGLAAASGALARAEQAQSAERVRARAAAPRGAAAVAPAPALSREDERRIVALYRRGVAALEAGHSDEALRTFELVRSIRPGHERVDELLKREYLTRGMELFSAGRLDAAARMWERALQVDPRDARALGYLARVHEQIARAREISGDAP